MKNFISKSFTLIILLLTFSVTSAQQNRTQYFMNLPQNQFMNPAFRPNMKWYIGLPVLSNTLVSIDNNLMTIDEVFENIPGTDSVMTVFHPDYDREALLKSIGNTVYLAPEINTQLLSFGFSIKDDWFFNFGLAEKSFAAAYIPGDLFRLLFDGNADFVGSTINLNGLNVGAISYVESSFGLSKNIGTDLRIGGNAKLLFGNQCAILNNDVLEIDVNQDFSHTLRADMSLNISSPIIDNIYYDDNGFLDSIATVEDFNPMEVIFNTNNHGFAVDLGGVYRITDEISVSASIVDLGFIKWSSRVFNLKANNNFSFDGFDLEGVIDGEMTADEMLDNFVDSLKNSFSFSDDGSDFITMLPTKIFIGGSYELADYLKFGLLSRSTIYKGHLRQSLTASANFYPTKNIGATLSYTMANRSYNNLGMGMVFRLGTVQLYLVTDQIPIGWVRIQQNGNNSMVLPNKVDLINLRFGMNLVFGRMVEKKADKPMLLD